MKTKFQFSLLFILFFIPLFGSETLTGFMTSPYFAEQIATFNLKNDMRIHINAPAAEDFNPQKPVGLVLFALPNGNSIEQTAGKVLKEGDDWHYDIQHIAAQTRFLRQKVDYNLVVVYLEASPRSWPAWKRNYSSDHGEIIKQTVDYLTSLFADYHPFVVLNGHSGGGRFIFSFLDAHSEIPANVKRIAFLDSNYGYKESYSKKITDWLKGSKERCLAVFAYNDSMALYKGKPVVSATGGTWYRSKMMLRDLTQSFTFTTIENDSLIQHSALNGRIQIWLKKNRDRNILHTVQVERNGFIHSMLTGTKLESQGYKYYSSRCYSSFIQQNSIKAHNINIPLLSPRSPGASVFMPAIEDMPFEEREQAILDEFLAGNVPYFMRELKTLKAVFSDSSGVEHNVAYRVFPDYLAVGKDDDYCRIPMGPITAQKIADFYGAVLSTRKLVDNIYQNAQIKLAPVPYKPVGDANEQVAMFVRHNAAIDSQMQAVGGYPGQLLAGIKKDVVLSNKLADSTRTHHVTIYGWHRLNGICIQPLTNIHINSYVDYSHGIRLLDRQIKVDGKVYDIETILKDKLLYTLLSDEDSPMTRSSY